MDFYVTKKIVNRGKPDIMITTDASNDGWGVVNKEVNIGVRWKDQLFGLDGCLFSNKVIY